MYQLAAIIFGLSIFSFVIYRAGLGTILDSLSKVGWGFFIVVALNGSRHLLRAFCVYLAVPDRERTFKYRNAVAARLGGEAAGIISFTGGLVSEATKAALLKGRLTLSRSVATIVVDNLIYDLSVILIMFGGAVMMLLTIDGLDTAVQIVLGFIALLMVLGLLGMFLAAFYRFKPMTYLLKHYGEKSWMPKFISKRRHSVNELENSVFDFYENRRATFFAMIAVNFIAHALSVVEVLFILRRLGVENTGVETAFIIESLTKVVNFAFSFVPGNLGVYEGGASVIFHALGLVGATGVALALVRRGAILVWTSVGILILFWRTISGNIRQKTEPDLN